MLPVVSRLTRRIEQKKREERQSVGRSLRLLRLHGLVTGDAGLGRPDLNRGKALGSPGGAVTGKFGAHGEEQQQRADHGPAGAVKSATEAELCRGQHFEDRIAHFARLPYWR